MAIATDTTEIEALDIVAGTPINCAIPLHSEDEVLVAYGIDELVAVLNTDYSVALDEENYNTFTLTPTTSLISKINALIAEDSDEINYILITRNLDYLTSGEPSTVIKGTFLSRELDRIAMRFQQLAVKVARTLLIRPEEGHVLVGGPGGTIINGPSIGSITDPEAILDDAIAARDAAQDASAIAVAASAGMKWRPSVRISTTANHALSGLTAIDGVTPIAGDRILAWNQTAPAENGVYVAAAGAWARADDANSWAELISQAVNVEEGTLYADYTFLCQANAGGTLGTTAVVWGTFKVIPLDNSISTNKYVNLSITVGKLADGILEATATGLAKMADLFVTTAKLADRAVDHTKVATGFLVQRVYSEYLANADITTQIPFDDTIPQTTEGVEILTASITPKSATNKLLIRFQGVYCTTASAANAGCALFVDATANALAAASGVVGVSYDIGHMALEYEEAAGSTATRTYRVRVGPGTGTTLRMNGEDNARRYGGKQRATLIIEEVEA